MRFRNSDRYGIKRLARIASLVMVPLMAVSMLTGCGKSDTASNSKVKISILAKNSWYSDVDYINADIVKSAIESTGYDVEWKLRDPSGYFDVVKPQLLAKEKLADIVQLPDLDASMEYIDRKIFVSLDSYMEKMPNFKKYLDENPDIRASLTADDGHIYYVPQTVLTKNYVPCIMYNKEWLAKAGVDEPVNLEDFTELLRKYKSMDMNGNGDSNDEIPMSVTPDLLPYMFGPAFGLDLVNGFYADSNGKVHYSYYEAENYRAYLEYLNGLYNEGLLESDFNAVTRDEITRRCAANTTGVIFDYSWHMSTLYSAQYPSYKGADGIYDGGKPLSGRCDGYYIGRSAISGMFGVSTDSEHVEDAVIMLDKLMSEDNQTLYCFGIKGQSYYIDDDGNKSYTDAAKDNMWLQQLGINPGCLPSRQSVEATDELLPIWHSIVDKELATYVKDPFPFIFATKAEEDADNGSSNYITKYVIVQSNSFITGKSSLESFDWYLQTLESMNVKGLIEIRQQQYDRYEK